MPSQPRLIRITTVPISLKLLLQGQFAFMQQNGFDVLTISATGKEIPDIQAEGTKHTGVNMTRSITPVKDLIALWKLILVFKQFKPDIVHSHTPKAGLLGMIAAWVCQVPIRMHTVAGLPLMESTGVKRRILKVTEQITYSCATHVYPNSNGLLKFIQEELKIGNHKLSMIGKGSTNGIDVDYFSKDENLLQRASVIRQENNIPSNAFIFCFVGRVVRDKGIVELVNAFQTLSATVPHCYLMLVGSFELDLDPLPEECYKFLHQSERVILPGFQNDIRPWMLAANAFVFPSYREGFPNVVMQACCLELPCIVSNINGCNELIEDGKGGWVVPVKSETALLKAMREVMLDQKEALRRAVFARHGVVTNFSRNYVWSELLKVYRKHLEKLGSIK